MKPKEVQIIINLGKVSKDNIYINSHITKEILARSQITKDIGISSAVTKKVSIHSPIGIESGESVFSPQFQAVYDAWIIKPSDELAASMDTMVLDMVTSGVWDKMDRIFIFAIHTNVNGEALIDWKDPTSNYCTLVNDPQFTALEGFTGDGATQYIDSNFSPDLDGVNYTLNSASIAAYSRTDIAPAFVSLAGARVATPVDLRSWIIPNFNNRFIGEMNTNEASSANTPTTNSLGAYSVITLSNQLVLYKNGVNLKSQTIVNIGIPTSRVFALGNSERNNPRRLFQGQVSNLLIGGGITDLEVAGKDLAFETYMDSNGRGVVL